MLARAILVVVVLASAVDWATMVWAQEQAPADRAVVIASGQLSLTAPADWVRKKPRSRMVAHEFALKAVEGDPTDGRLTVMAAGGSVKANIDRWIGQFTQPDGKPSRERAKLSNKKVAGQQVHLVDITGTFQDRPRGPIGPTVSRDNYRMLGAIIEAEGQGRHFIKLYGPLKTITKADKAFAKFIDSLQSSPN